MSKITNDKGCLWEGGGFEIEINKEVNVRKADVCEHLVFLGKDKDAALGFANAYIAPAVVVADNDAGHNSTGVCLYCIFELAKRHNLELKNAQKMSGKKFNNINDVLPPPKVNVECHCGDDSDLFIASLWRVENKNGEPFIEFLVHGIDKIQFSCPKYWRFIK